MFCMLDLPSMSMGVSQSKFVSIGGGGGVSFNRDFSGDPGGDGNLGRPLMDELGVVPLDGGVALLDDLEAGRLYRDEK